MSNIVRARFLLKKARSLRESAEELQKEAEALLHREKPVRKAHKRYVKITQARRSEIERLALDPNLTVQDIAVLTGLRSSGRVSEVLNGKH